MEQKKLISIIIPVYNAGQYLQKCLESLARQTISAIEFLLIDDGSTDNSAEICKKFCDGDVRFQYYYQSNRGVSAARNLGLQKAKGELIGFCDSDDWVDSDMYETLCNLLHDYDADIAIVQFVSEPQGKDTMDMNTKSVVSFDAKNAIVEMHKGKLFQGHLWNKIFKRNLFDAFQFREDIAIYEDMLAVWQLLMRAQKVVYQDVAKYHYFNNPESVLHQKFKPSYWSVQLACREMLSLMQQYYPDQIAYAEKTLLMGNLGLINRLSGSGLLTKQNYRQIKEEISQTYCNGALALVGKNDRLKLRIFMNGRIPFIFYYKLLKVYRSVR